MSDEDLKEAIETLLTTRANRFSKNQNYLDYIKRCVEELHFKIFEEAFLFGGLDAMIQDFASAEQMNLPAKHPTYDPGHRDNRLERLKRWKQLWESENRLPFKEF